MGGGGRAITFDLVSVRLYRSFRSEMKSNQMRLNFLLSET